MESTTTNICVNVTMYYWKLCSGRWGIIATSSPNWTPLKHFLHGTRTPRHTHKLSPSLSGFSKGVIIFTSFPFYLQPSDRRYMLIVNHFKPRGRGKARELLSCTKAENKIQRKGEKSPLEDRQFSIPAHHSPKRKRRVKQQDSTLTLSWNALKQLPGVSFLLN